MSRDDLDHLERWDTYAEAVAKVIEAKREDRPLAEAPEPEKPGKVLDLMAVLTQSAEKGRACRGDDVEDLVVAALSAQMVYPASSQWTASMASCPVRWSTVPSDATSTLVS